MKNIYAFIDTKREKVQYRPVKERLKDYKEVEVRRNELLIDTQVGRCMNAVHLSVTIIVLLETIFLSGMILLKKADGKRHGND